MSLLTWNKIKFIILKFIYHTKTWTYTVCLKDWLLLLKENDLIEKMTFILRWWESLNLLQLVLSSHSPWLETSALLSCKCSASDCPLKKKKTCTFKHIHVETCGHFSLLLSYCFKILKQVLWTTFQMPKNRRENTSLVSPLNWLHLIHMLISHFALLFNSGRSIA